MQCGWRCSRRLNSCLLCMAHSRRPSRGNECRLLPLCPFQMLLIYSGPAGVKKMLRLAEILADCFSDFVILDSRIAPELNRSFIPRPLPGCERLC